MFKETTGSFLKSSINKNWEKEFVAPLLDQSEVAKRQKVAVKGGQLTF